MEQRQRRDDLEASLLYLCEDQDLIDYVDALVQDREDAQDVIRVVCEDIRGWRREQFDPSTGMEGLRNWIRELCLEASKTYRPYGTWRESPVFGDGAWGYDDGFWDEIEHDRRYRSAVIQYSLGAHDLTPRQRDCFNGVIAGKSQAQIAKELNLSTQTVNQHFTAARKKFNPHNPDLRTPGDRWRSGKPSRKRHQTDPEADRTMDRLLNNILANEEADAPNNP
jgi:DNA-binding CsgD family transcriptional regulator